MLIDLFTCVVAFALEKDEDWTLLAPLILQRFYYRQMMYVVLFRALREAAPRTPGWLARRRNAVATGGSIRRPRLSRKSERAFAIFIPEFR